MNTMAKFRKYTDKDISMLLETNSNSDAKEFDESYVPKESTDFSSDSSNSDQIFDNKSLLLRTNALQKEQTSLRLKLRRSTEQSVYKIDTASEDERPKRITRSTKHLKSLQNKNQMLRKNVSKRVIKLPKRYSDYECSKSQAPILQREQINYNEKELLLSSLDIPTERERKSKHAIKNDDSDDSNCICIDFIPKTSMQSNTISKNKQNRVYLIENTNDNAAPKVTRTRFLKHISVDRELKKCNVDKVLLRTHKKVPRYSNPNKILHTSFDSTFRGRSRIERNTSMLNISNQCESVYKDECKNKIDEIEIIEEVDKKLLTKNKLGKKNIKNTTESSKSYVSLKHNALTPSMKMRTEALAKPITPLQEARTTLHVSVIPKSLPCREEQFNNIYTFLKDKLIDNIGGCIYVSGVPGTGKTATVNEVVKCLKRSVDKGKLAHFNFVEINGMKLSEPRQAYIQILKQLCGRILNWEQAYNMLEKKFNNSTKSTKRPMTLLLVDELDLLYTKRQDVIYNLLDWPTKVSAQLVVIAIANTMDLPERVLMGRVTSRLGLTRVTFQPYNHKQLQEIVLTRLKDIDIFKSEAIQLIARKVSAVSGDARRALDICRRAAEIAETHDGAKVTIQDVNEALSEIIRNSKVQAIKHCSKFEQIFLQAVCMEVTRTGVEEVCFINIYKKFESLCFFNGYETPNITQMLDICIKLSDYRLLICEYSNNDIHQRILLNVSKNEMHYALEKVSLD